MTTSLRTIEEGAPALYVISLQADLLEDGSQRSAYAVPVLTRKEGVILALPVN